MEVSDNLIETEYAVRGKVPAYAEEIKDELAKQGINLIKCNIGNPQAFDQQPISWYREIQSLVMNPDLIDRLGDVSEFNMEVLKIINKGLNGKGLGPYSESKGHAFFREGIANFIDKRDVGLEKEIGSLDEYIMRDDFVLPENFVRANPENIFMTNGASAGVYQILAQIINKRNDGVMIPIPQYPLYSASITELGGEVVGYYPDPKKGWIPTREDLEKSLAQAKTDNIEVKAIALINPGNPTGANLSKEALEEFVDFAEDHKLMILTDEVYQDNMYGSDTFHSLAKIVGNRDATLVSYHSTSKGFIGQCGDRGGYFEIRNPPELTNKTNENNESFMSLLNKKANMSLCPNTPAQLLTYLMTNPPSIGTPEREQYDNEAQSILQSLERKANMFDDAFSQMKGVEVFGKSGALYKFPQIDLPKGKKDEDYSMHLVEKSGFVTVPGSGFWLPGHVRFAILPSEKQLEEAFPKLIKASNQYMDKHSLAR